MRSLPGIVILLVMLTTVSGCDFGNGPRLREKRIKVSSHGLRIYRAGRGTPTVVLDTGLGDTHTAWEPLLRKVANTTRVCLYDRAAYGESEPGPVPRDCRQEAQELKLLLENAGEKGPFLLVGHGLGGLNIQVFADRYPDLVAGMILMDPHPIGWMTHHDQFPEVYEVFKSRIHDLADQADRHIRSKDPLLHHDVSFLRTLVSEHAELIGASGKQVAAIQSFGDIPLLVIGSEKPDAVYGESAIKFRLFWNEESRVLAGKSTMGSFMVIPGSSHYFQVDAPDLIVGEIIRMIGEIRKGS